MIYARIYPETVYLHVSIARACSRVTWSTALWSQLSTITLPVHLQGQRNHGVSHNVQFCKNTADVTQTLLDIRYV